MSKIRLLAHPHGDVGVGDRFHVVMFGPGLTGENFLLTTRDEEWVDKRNAAPLYNAQVMAYVGEATVRKVTQEGTRFVVEVDEDTLDPFFGTVFATIRARGGDLSTPLTPAACRRLMA